MKEACTPSDNISPCCLDYDGTFGDGQPVKRSGPDVTDECRGKAVINYIFSTCQHWVRAKVCWKEAAFVVGGPSCWETTSTATARI
jgi:hypothetical protein